MVRPLSGALGQLERRHDHQGTDHSVGTLQCAIPHSRVTGLRAGSTGQALYAGNELAKACGLLVLDVVALAAGGLYALEDLDEPMAEREASTAKFGSKL